MIISRAHRVSNYIVNVNDAQLILVKYREMAFSKVLITSNSPSMIADIFQNTHHLSLRLCTTLIITFPLVHLA